MPKALHEYTEQEAGSAISKVYDVLGLSEGDKVKPSDLLFPIGVLTGCLGGFLSNMMECDPNRGALLTESTVNAILTATGVDKIIVENFLKNCLPQGDPK